MKIEISSSIIIVILSIMIQLLYLISTLEFSYYRSKKIKIYITFIKKLSYYFLYLSTLTVPIALYCIGVDIFNSILAGFIYNLFFMLLFRVIVYNYKIYIFNLIIFVIIIIGGVISHFTYSHNPDILIFIMMLIIFIFFTNIAVEDLLSRHFEYRIKNLFNNNYKVMRMENIKISNKMYLFNIKLVNWCLIAISVILLLIFFLVTLNGIDELLKTIEHNKIDKSLSLLGVSLGILGLVGILLTLENNRNSQIKTYKRFLFLLEEKNSQQYKNIFEELDTSLMEGSDLESLFNFIIYDRLSN